MARVVAGFALLAGTTSPALAADAPGGAARAVEKEFEATIKTVTPATVFCVADRDKFGPGGGSSGVLVTRDGYVLSDSDAGFYWKPVVDAKGKPVVGADGRPPPPEKAYADVVEVRIPDLKRGSYVVYTAKVVRRVVSVDSALLKIEKPPPSGFPFVVPRTSADLDVGQFTFAVGTSFPQGDAGATSSLTAGIVSALVPLAPGNAGGAWAEIYTSAAVNLGVNGGPLVDADATLVGMVSTWVQMTKIEDILEEARQARTHAGLFDPFQFLGKAFPIDRIRAAYKDLPVYAKVFPDPKIVPVRSKETALLEQAIGATAKRVAPSVVGLEILRSEPLKMIPVAPNARELLRYRGPTSGVVVSRDGWIVASLYAFADIGPIADIPSPVAGDVATDLAKVLGVTAHFSDGTSAPARVVAHDERWGLVCLKATLPAGFDATPAEPASADALIQGRLVIGIARPFASRRVTLPLVTLGMLSRIHPVDARKPWAGHFQTDANMTDGTVGGALVDVHGRLLGMATLWNPAMQGRNSGIGFGVPWPKIEEALPALRAGTSYRFGMGYMGVRFSGGSDVGGVPVEMVETNSAADRAGLKVGDRVFRFEGAEVDDVGDIQTLLHVRKPGDRVKIRVKRDTREIELEVVLGERSPPQATAPPSPPPAPPAMSDTPSMGG